MASSGKVFLAVDIGASSGRVLAGLLSDGKIDLQEVHRFENGVNHVQDRLQWNLLGLWASIKDGLRGAAQKYGDSIASMGVDTWGVDFGLLGRHDEILGNPYCYRDSQTAGILDEAFAIVSRDEIYDETGLQFMEFNSLYQLLAMKRDQSAILDSAASLLMMPDLFHWLLTGIKSNEQTNASTTQFFNPTKQDWSQSLLQRFGLPTDLVQPLTQPTTILGPVQKSVMDEVGLPQADVVLPGTHDTASAVLSVPAVGEPSQSPNWCYISSGTWSLMGIETAKPVITQKSRELNFTNEGGVGGTSRVLKNIAGLWLIQECRRIWSAEGHDHDWGELVDMANAAQPLQSVFDPDDTCFVAPDNMPQAIRTWCQQSGQTVPESEGEVIRCAYESLALRYRSVLGWLEELIGNRIETVHIVGGGTQNQLLCQMTADACNRQVVTGPVEATAIGNVMAQAVASGEIESVQQAREVIRNSFDVQTFEPRDPSRWDEAFDRFMRLAGT